MSAIAAVFRRDGAPADASALGGMLGRMRARGGERSATWTDGAVAIGAARQPWELASAFGGPPLAVEEDGVAVAADASLYYRAELRARLERDGVAPAEDSPGHLILAAYRAWGPRCAERLEGDFAFVLWDRRKGTLLCARDPAGGRPLYYAVVGETVLVGSSSAAIAGHPLCPRDLNLALVTELASGLFGVGDESCFAAVSQLPAAHALLFGERRTERWRYWTPPPVTPFRRASLEEGARELRALLGRAVTERMDPEGPTSVWMSGGRDSTALFGVGMDAARAGDARELRPVSVSYPEGDPGREDEYIEAILKRWNASTHWIDIRDVPMLDRLGGRAAGREDVYFNPYETANRALVAGSRAVGSRVALNGGGADGLFSHSPAYMSDLFYGGRWLACAAEWRAKGMRGLRPFYRWVVLPGMPGWVAGAAAAARGGRPLSRHLERRLAPWFRPAAARRLGIAERQEGARREAAGPGAIAREVQLYLTYPFFPRNACELGGLGLEGGVEIRRPFLDRRVVEFAASRPWWEKYRGTETKIVQRHAMRGLLPDEVLATRPSRTGVCDTYFDLATRRPLTAMIRHAFRDSCLAELGIVDVPALLKAADDYGAGRARRRGGELIWTLHAELWLRARLQSPPLAFFREIDGLACGERGEATDRPIPAATTSGGAAA